MSPPRLRRTSRKGPGVRAVQVVAGAAQHPHPAVHDERLNQARLADPGLTGQTRTDAPREPAAPNARTRATLGFPLHQHCTARC
jgi:hypothetical protein